MPFPTDLNLSAIGPGIVSAASFAASAIAPMNIGNETQRATAALPQSTPGSIFTIAGGKVLILGIYGEVTTVIQTQTNATKLQAKATGQTAVDLCATLDITAKAVGSYFGITGTAATAMANGFAIPAQTTPWVVGPGTIDLNCAASNTGAVKWVCHWVPIDAGATVVTA